jgi:hypothetical protein
MAGPAFGTLGTSSGGGSGTTCTIPVPASVAAGDIIVVFIYIETTQAVTPDTGFTQAPDSPVVVTGSHAHDLRVYWKRATAADAGNYTFTIAAGLAWRMGFALRFTGCISYGDPWDVTNSAIKTTTTTAVTPAVSDTTTGPERLWVWAGSYFNGDATCTPPTGFAERADISGGVAVDVATKDQALQGASGSLVGTFSGNGGTGAWLGALRPTAGKFLALF